VSHSPVIPKPDAFAPIIGRIMIGTISAAIGGVAVLAMYLGITRAGLPVTPLGMAMSIPVPMFAVLGLYAAPLIWFGHFLDLANPGRRRIAVILGTGLMILAALIYLGVMLSQAPA